jgi:hypothetical protein
MLDIALNFLKDEINTYLLTRTSADPANPVRVETTKLVDEAGKYALALNSIGACLINLEEERIFKAQQPDRIYTNGQHIVREPELKLNLYILFAAHFQRYDQALKYLSYLLTYFQSHPSFTAEVYPTLDRSIAKLTPELQSLTYEQLNQIWAFIGGKQLPSAIYKVRMVCLQDEIPIAVQTPTVSVNTNLHSY